MVCSASRLKSRHNPASWNGSIPVTRARTASRPASGPSPPYVSLNPVRPESVFNSTMVRSANGACRPYELRNGGAATAIGGNTSSVIFMARDGKGKGPISKGGGRATEAIGARGLLARAAARVPDLRLTHLDLFSLGLGDLEGAAAHVLRLIQFIVRQKIFS